MKKWFVLFALLLSALMMAAGVQAGDQINYTSHPDEVVIFLNNIAFARDTLQLPGGADVAVVLPDTIYQDTLILRENDQRVPVYRINYVDGQILLHWQSAVSADLREVTLEYLLSGLSWTPKYDMWIGDEEQSDDDTEMVAFDFFAEITNSTLSLDEAGIRLVAGHVDTSQQIDAATSVTMNQYIAGYDRSGAGMVAESPTLTGQASIHHIYDAANVSTEPGDVVYLRLQESTLPARRIHLWNASTDLQVKVIYKVLNETTLPFAEGIVRSYEDGLFIGSDFVELTPIGGEGSVTVGNLQGMRVSRTETRTAISGSGDWDTQHDVTLELTNFGEEAEDVVVVDRYTEHAIGFSFSVDPERQGDNLLRWAITVPAGETITITYQFVAHN